MLTRMDPVEYAGWQAYFSIDPFGLQREDARFAMLATVLAQLQGAKHVHLSRFMLYPEHRVSQMSNEELILNAKLLAGWFSGNHSRGS